ncbi:hypothetical protein SAMN04489764_3271 [Thermostaphylospora chromogena]|uniref:Uncharacterized protein n=1 Tax=Thermostaphylospora chromogena TaxID=35622 RepID=A0A1H1FZ13_9ACTN|nr:hypothetical protein SAMN04489764_3271 [Thermostaphylospora chromogena]
MAGPHGRDLALRQAELHPASVTEANPLPRTENATMPTWVSSSTSGRAGAALLNCAKVVIRALPDIASGAKPIPALVSHHCRGG